MAIRKSREETLVVDGPRWEWLQRCRDALARGGFSKIETEEQLGQLHAAYRKVSVWGSLDITLLPDGDARTQLQLVASGNVDNIYALFRSPSKRILEAFKSGLLDSEVS